MLAVRISGIVVLKIVSILLPHQIQVILYVSDKISTLLFKREQSVGSVSGQTNPTASIWGNGYLGATDSAKTSKPQSGIEKRQGQLQKEREKKPKMRQRRSIPKILINYQCYKHDRI
jgi:hypothetical protein